MGAPKGWQQNSAALQQTPYFLEKRGEGSKNRSGDEEDSECTSVLLNDNLNPADLSVGFYEGDVEEFSN